MNSTDNSQDNPENVAGGFRVGQWVTHRMAWLGVGRIVNLYYLDTLNPMAGVYWPDYDRRGECRLDDLSHADG